MHTPDLLLTRIGLLSIRLLKYVRIRLSISHAYLSINYFTLPGKDFKVLHQVSPSPSSLYQM